MLQRLFFLHMENIQNVQRRIEMTWNWSFSWYYSVSGALKEAECCLIAGHFISVSFCFNACCCQQMYQTNPSRCESPPQSGRSRTCPPGLKPHSLSATIMVLGWPPICQPRLTATATVQLNSWTALSLFEKMVIDLSVFILTCSLKCCLLTRPWGDKGTQEKGDEGSSGSVKGKQRLICFTTKVRNKTSLSFHSDV